MGKYHYYIYIMASAFGTLYIGMTNNIHRRIVEHKKGKIKGFSKQYQCNKLVYIEKAEDVSAVIAREKQLKKWNRKKKENLIRIRNPQWKDLSKKWENEFEE